MASPHLFLLAQYWFCHSLHVSAFFCSFKTSRQKNGIRKENTLSIVIYCIFQVTADINVFAHFFLDSAVISGSATAIMKALVGPLPFYLIFLFNQIYKVFAVLTIGVLNVSAFLQFSIITNQRWGTYNLINFTGLHFSWIMNLSDDKIMKYAKTAIFFHVGVNIYELTMVW